MTTMDFECNNSAMRSQVRLYAILARKKPVAVVFRRGPSKQVQLIKWNTEQDTFEYGQWFKGRIYERRCDLSPNGDLLIYFAAKYKGPLFSWTAISRPPYLSALALWPKGDGWGGGGRFVSDARIDLNHRPDEVVLADGFSVPKRFKLRLFGKSPGWGEDDPIWSSRLIRDGWILVSYPSATKDDYGSKVMLEYSPPIIWRKPNPKWPRRFSVEMAVLGLNERNGSWYMVEHIVNRGGDEVDKLGRTDWADWSSTGDLLFAMNGCLYRLPCREGVLASLEESVKLVDLSGSHFEFREAPDRFRQWPKT